jgi:hypothetical protein
VWAGAVDWKGPWGTDFDFARKIIAVGAPPCLPANRPDFPVAVVDSKKKMAANTSATTGQEIAIL